MERNGCCPSVDGSILRNDSECPAQGTTDVTLSDLKRRMVYELSHNANSAATATVSTCNRASGRTLRSRSL